MYQCRREPLYSALFVALARFNHSCLPNAVNDADRAVARVRAVRTINCGEEVCISYCPVGHNLFRRTRALDGFGFRCACARCVDERERDPAFSTPCLECGVGLRTLVRKIDCSPGNNSDDSEGGGLEKNEIDDNVEDEVNPFSSLRVLGPCSLCGSPSASSDCLVDSFSIVAKRHAAVQAAVDSIRDAEEDYEAEHGELMEARHLAEAALLLAPFATHPVTMALHRGLVRLQRRLYDCEFAAGTALGDLAEGEERSMRAVTQSRKQWCLRSTLEEQLREIKRMDQAHGESAHGKPTHRDLQYMRCFARLVKGVRQLRQRRQCSHGRGSGPGCAGPTASAVQPERNRRNAPNVEDTDEKIDDSEEGKEVGDGPDHASSGHAEDNSEAALAALVELRWANLCEGHFGERVPPDSFIASIDDAEDDAPQYLPIGASGERLALFNDDDEIDLSLNEIGDLGCSVLLDALVPSTTPSLMASTAAYGVDVELPASPAAALSSGGIGNVIRYLDLESNGLSCTAGVELGKGLAAGGRRTGLWRV